MDRARNLSGGTPAIELPGLRFALGEDIDMLRATVRGFAQAEIAPRAAEIDRSNQFPSDLWRKMGALGLLGVTVEEAYGGTLMGYAAHIVAMEEISRASASVGLSYGAHSNLCVNQIRRNGTETQKRKYLPRLVAGELVFVDVEVPAENVLGTLNGGAKVLMSGLDYERAVLAAGPVGIMQAVM